MMPLERPSQLESADFHEASGFRVTVGTNGFCGGDAGHGSRTFLELSDIGGSEIEIAVGSDGRRVAIALGGDSELSTFIKALDFAAKTLRRQAKVRHNSGVTVGDLISQLEAYPSNAEIHMGGLQFYRLKQRGDDLVQLEFAQQVYRDEDGEIVVEEVEE